MCGIAGIVQKTDEAVSIRHLLEMGSILSHRGPDDEMFALFNIKDKKAHLFSRENPPALKGGIGFAFRRLSIIDLSKAASQPMKDSEDDIWIIYNGEIFNYIEIRAELKSLGHVFHTQSDTEVILKAYKNWGFDCQHRFNGMWAFVILDLKRNVLFGSRDRFGIKPFYYHNGAKQLSFASEIKALLHLPWIRRIPHSPVIKDYLCYSRVDTSRFTFFRGIHHLEPGHFMIVDLNREFNLKIQPWWNLENSLSKQSMDENDLFSRFRFLLRSAVRLRLRSDVPIGTCLSGGLDSSAIVALANPFLKEGRQRSFSIIQPGHPSDESRYMDEIIQRFNLTARKTNVSGEDFRHEMIDVIRTQDEPFTSTSMYAQWKVFELARSNGVTVTLDGQGADEELAGYRYFQMVYQAELLGRGKLESLFKEIHGSSSSFPAFLWNGLSSLSGFLPHRKMIAAAGLKDPQYDTSWINHAFFKNTPLPHRPVQKIFPSRLNQRLYEVFTHDGLPALLRYADRNSMAHSLESRMPFMDHNLVSFLFSLEPDHKIRNGLSKYILRKSLEGIVPSLILERRDKVPFLTSEAQWFRRKMRDDIGSILSSDSFRSRNYFQAGKAQSLFNRHVNGKIDASRPLWRLINLELWMREYID